MLYDYPQTLHIKSSAYGFESFKCFFHFEICSTAVYDVIPFDDSNRHYYKCKQKISGSIPQLLRTLGSTIPQPNISRYPVPLVIL